MYGDIWGHTYIIVLPRYIMNTSQIEQNCFEAKEIFRQLQASKVNGFPFFAYTGIKPSIFSEESLYLKTPKNPGGYKSILVMYDKASDTYKVNFYDHEEIPSGDDKQTDIYADQLVDLIIRKMGVN